MKYLARYKFALNHVPQVSFNQKYLGENLPDQYLLPQEMLLKGESGVISMISELLQVLNFLI